MATFGSSILRFGVRLDRREHPGCSLFRGQRIHLGAHKAAVLSTIPLCVGSAVVFKCQKNYWYVKLVRILLGLTLIHVLFHTYNNDWLLFKYSLLAFSATCLIGALFVLFTFIPLQIPLFQDFLFFVYSCLILDANRPWLIRPSKLQSPHLRTRKRSLEGTAFRGVFGFDHIFDHRPDSNTRKQWRKQFRKAPDSGINTAKRNIKD